MAEVTVVVGILIGLLVVAIDLRQPSVERGPIACGGISIMTLALAALSAHKIPDGVHGEIVTGAFVMTSVIFTALGWYLGRKRAR